MPRSARIEGFSRRHRFSGPGSFAAPLRSARKLRGRLAILHVAAVPGASRLGIALTRRLVRSSVHRNRVKRGIREAFRAHSAKALSLDCVVTLREKVDAQSVAAVVQEVRMLLDQLVRSPAK